MGSPDTGFRFRTAPDDLMHVFPEHELDEVLRLLVQAIGNHGPHVRASLRRTGGIAMCVPCAVAMETAPEYTYDHSCLPSNSSPDHHCRVCGSPCHC